MHAAFKTPGQRSWPSRPVNRPLAFDNLTARIQSVRNHEKEGATWHRPQHLPPGVIDMSGGHFNTRGGSWRNLGLESFVHD